MTGWGEYDAARYLLETPLIASRTEPFIMERSFDWDGLLDSYGYWSTGEQLLVDAAFALWRGSSDQSVGLLGRLVWSLDRSNVERVAEAIRIYAGIGAPTA